MQRTRGNDEDVELRAEQDLIEKTFFVFDDKCTDERATSEEIPLFFYPPSVPIDQKLFLIGSVFAFISFAQEFTKEDVQIITLERSKLAVRSLGKNAYMVLGAALDETDYAVIHHLKGISEAFEFNNGPFANFQQRWTGRMELISRLEKSCRELIPLILTSHRSSVSPFYKSFNPLPYLELPANCNRYFLYASQIMHNLIAEVPHNIASAIYYDGSILCSHLDIGSTRWIKNKLDYQKATTNIDNLRFSGASVSNPRLTNSAGAPNPNNNEEYNQFTHVFLSKSQLKQLRDHPHNHNNPPSSLDQSGEGKRTPETNYFHHDEDVLPVVDPNDGEFVGLLTLTVSNITLAVVTELSALRDPRHVNKVRLCMESKLNTLDKHLNKIFKKPTLTPSSGSSHISAHISAHLSSHLSNVSRSNVPDLGLVDSIPNYNYLVSDSLQEIVKGSNLVPRETDNRFLNTANHVHNLFYQSPSFTQVWLRDHSGYMYCSKMFHKETFYQQFYMPEQEKIMDKIEDEARRALAEDFNIFLI